MRLSSLLAVGLLAVIGSSIAACARRADPLAGAEEIQRRANEPAPFGQGILGYNIPLQRQNGIGARAVAQDGFLAISIQNLTPQSIVIGPDQFRLLEEDRTTTALTPQTHDLSGFGIRTVAPGDATAASVRFPGAPDLAGRVLVFQYPPAQVLIPIQIEAAAPVTVEAPPEL